MQVDVQRASQVGTAFLTVLLGAGVAPVAQATLAEPVISAAGTTAAVTATVPSGGQATTPGKILGAKTKAGFVPIGSLTAFWSMAGADRQNVYVSGAFADAPTTAGLYLLKGKRRLPVDLPGVTGREWLSQVNGTVYAIASGSLYRLNGTHAVKIDVPSKIDGVYPSGVRAVGPDGKGGLWIAAGAGAGTPGVDYHSYSPGAVAFAHLDGQSWSAFVTDFGYRAGVRSSQLFTVNGALHAEVMPAWNHNGEAGISWWDGKTWNSVGMTRANTITSNGYFNDSASLTQSGSAYLAGWGADAIPSGAPPEAGTKDAKGMCRVYEAPAGVGCIAPKWPVSAAASLADGRVLLGGADSMYGRAAAASAGFAIVPTPGAAPVPVEGDNGAAVAALTGNTRATAAWAVTSNPAGGGLTLQRLKLPKAPHQPTRQSAAAG